MRIYVRIKKMPIFIYVPNRFAFKYLSHQDEQYAKLWKALGRSLRHYRGYTFLEVDCPDDDVHVRIKF